MNIKYTCEFTFSDPNDQLFDYKLEVAKILPQTTYAGVKKFMYEQLSQSSIDIPTELSKIEFNIIKEEIVS